MQGRKETGQTGKGRGRYARSTNQSFHKKTPCDQQNEPEKKQNAAREQRRGKLASVNVRNRCKADRKIKRGGEKRMKQSHEKFRKEQGNKLEGEGGVHVNIKQAKGTAVVLKHNGEKGTL